RAERVAGQSVSNRVEALYGQAVTWHLRRPGEDAARADKLYRDVMATAPAHDLAGWSALGLARLPESLPPGKEPPREERLQGCQAVIDRFPGHPAAEEAFLLQQGLRLAAPSSDDEPREVLAALDAFLEAHTNSPNVSTVWSLIEQAATWLSLPDRRLEAVLQQWRTAPVNPAATNAVTDLSLTYWRIATLAEFEVGNFDLARAYYGKLIDEYPTQQRVFLAKQELRRMAELEARLRQEGTP
ncbi:MAG: tetratricopeptide repeat protein, partial [Verrucomicrobia bacterium]|nr:tetratricopeptide repeat protein [Verrucomicrobiota bacterium]